MQKLYKPKLRFLQYLYCRAAAPPSADWQLCTGDATGFDPVAIAQCAEGVEGVEGAKLLVSSRAHSLNSNITVGPHLRSEQPNQDARSPC